MARQPGHDLAGVAAARGCWAATRVRAIVLRRPQPADPRVGPRRRPQRLLHDVLHHARLLPAAARACAGDLAGRGAERAAAARSWPRRPSSCAGVAAGGRLRSWRRAGRRGRDRRRGAAGRLSRLRRDLLSRWCWPGCDRPAAAGAGRRAGRSAGAAAGASSSVMAFGLHLPDLGAQGRLVTTDEPAQPAWARAGQGGETETMRSLLTVVLVVPVAACCCVYGLARAATPLDRRRLGLRRAAAHAQLGAAVVCAVGAAVGRALALARPAHHGACLWRLLRAHLGAAHLHRAAARSACAPNARRWGNSTSATSRSC